MTGSRRVIGQCGYHSCASNGADSSRADIIFIITTTRVVARVFRVVSYNLAVFPFKITRRNSMYFRVIAVNRGYDRVSPFEISKRVSRLSLHDRADGSSCGPSSVLVHSLCAFTRRDIIFCELKQFLVGARARKLVFPISRARAIALPGHYQ